VTTADEVQSVNDAGKKVKRNRIEETKKKATTGIEETNPDDSASLTRRNARGFFSCAGTWLTNCLGTSIRQRCLGLLFCEPDYFGVQECRNRGDSARLIELSPTRDTPLDDGRNRTQRHGT
jgi:hypothetical protein